MVTIGEDRPVLRRHYHEPMDKEGDSFSVSKLLPNTPTLLIYSILRHSAPP
jgi:hypothetical protein